MLSKLYSYPEYINAKSVSVFISMPGAEIQTTALIRRIFSDGKACFVPRWGSGSEMEMVKLKDYFDFESLPLNSWKIPEPSESDDRESAFSGTGLDLIIMPGLAFDRDGRRLGHGKGYYDRFLQKCENFAKDNKLRTPYTIALALSAQIVEEIPVDNHDKKPDVILQP